MKTPLIITLKLGEDDQRFFDAMRKEHFPGHINYIDAHCTLFHTLPSDKATVRKALVKFCNCSPFNMQVAGIQNTGNGIAYVIVSAELQALHISMQKNFQHWLTRKDRQKLQPHITIQNKVTAFKAHNLFEKLNTSFEPFVIKATGLSTWHYLKGPWKHIEDFCFNVE